MKKVLLTMVGCLFAVTTAFASPAKADIEGLILNKADASAMFGDANMEKVALLGADEMKSTEGEFWPIFWALSYAYVSYLNAPSYNNRLYGGVVYSSRYNRFFR